MAMELLQPRIVDLLVQGKVLDITQTQVKRVAGVFQGTKLPCHFSMVEQGGWGLVIEPQVEVLEEEEVQVVVGQVGVEDTRVEVGLGLLDSVAAVAHSILGQAKSMSQASTRATDELPSFEFRINQSYAKPTQFPSL